MLVCMFVYVCVRMHATTIDHTFHVLAAESAAIHNNLADGDPEKLTILYLSSGTSLARAK